MSNKKTFPQPAPQFITDEMIHNKTTELDESMRIIRTRLYVWKCNYERSLSFLKEQGMYDAYRKWEADRNARKYRG